VGLLTAFATFATWVGYHQKGSFLEFLGASQSDYDTRVGRLCFFDGCTLSANLFAILSDLSSSSCLTRYERRFPAPLSVCSGGLVFLLAATSVFNLSLHPKFIHHLYKQHGLDNNLDEQELELAHYICSICGDFDTQKFHAIDTFPPLTPRA
jgi:hypothetical protein